MLWFTVFVYIFMVTGKLNIAALQSCQSFTEQHFYSWYKNTFHKTQLAPVEIIQTLESEAVCFCCRREPSITYKNVCCKSNFTYQFSFLYQRTLWPNKHFLQKKSIKEFIVKPFEYYNKYFQNVFLKLYQIFFANKTKI